MKIPTSTKKSRFYIATSMTEAFSSWSSLSAAQESYNNLPLPDRVKVIGIIEVCGILTTKHKVQ